MQQHFPFVIPRPRPLAVQPMRELLNSLPQTGRVEWIGRAAASHAPVIPTDEVFVRIGTGIDGEHHARGGRSKRQVTLFQHEHLAVVASILKRTDTPPELLRRNIVVSGINLLAFKDKAFQIGEAILKGTGPCDPCSRMEENFGPGGYNALRGHGGITTIVLREGTIRVGDAVRLLSPEEAAPLDPPATAK
jgi:MOSC domain-containing protein YiiM